PPAPSVADLNGDGKSDILLRHAGDGTLVIQLQNGATSIGGGGITNNVWDPTWQVVGVGDFNGDRKSDILLRHAGDGALVVQLQDGATSIGGGPITNDVWDPSWQVVDVGDFNGDGKADILLRHAADGTLVVQLQDGATSIGGGPITNNAWDPSWQVVGVADFN